VPITLGANGTKGGLATDEFSRVVNHRGEPIPGLFAVGESAAALMGPGYAGSGASLGPALTSAFTLADALSPPAPESVRSHSQTLTWTDRRTERAGQ
jgi:3-oxosteroid 1-dehydrogenase